jgi:hypothetical protein
MTGEDVDARQPVTQRYRSTTALQAIGRHVNPSSSPSPLEDLQGLFNCNRYFRNVSKYLTTFCEPQLGRWYSYKRMVNKTQDYSVRMAQNAVTWYNETIRKIAK